MKVFLVDDERLARAELRLLLSAHPEITVGGEAANVAEALRLLPEVHPDLLFLDIEMPGRGGFDLLAALPPPHPRIVFVTAYDAHALRAFEVDALDYLLKPVSPERLAASLARVRARLTNPAAPAPAAPADEDDAPAPENEAPLGENDQVFVRDGERCWFVPVRDIRLLESEGNHTRVHFGSSRPLVHRPLAAVEARLPASWFLRANRAQVVHRGYIEKIEPWFGGGLRATLRGGGEVEFSRRQARLLRLRLGL